MKNPVGTGPYKFVEWKPDRYLLLERFEKYKTQPGRMNGFGGERIAYLDKIKFVPVSEESVATMALLNKEIDFLLHVPFKDVEKYRKDYVKRGVVLDEVEGLSWYGIFFDCDKRITKEVKFRRACAYAIDRKFVASRLHPPEGCRFHTRCLRALEVCSRVEPEWKEGENGHFTAVSSLLTGVVFCSSIGWSAPGRGNS